MRKSLYFCDWCGREITHDIKYPIEIFGMRDKLYFHYNANEDDDEDEDEYESGGYKRELCGACAAKLRTFLTRQDHGEGTEEEKQS